MAISSPYKRARSDILNEAPFGIFQHLKANEFLFQDFPLKSELENLDLNGFVSSYVLSNESDRHLIVDKIPENLNPDLNHVHIGFACDVNFDIIARRRSKYAIIADIDPEMFKAYQVIKQTLELANSREDFVDKFLSNIDIQNAFGIFGLKKEDWKTSHLSSRTYDLLNQSYSWLGSDESFNFIKNIFRENRCLFIKLNILNHEDIIKISRWLESKQLTIDSMYLSNISEWLDFRGQLAYKANVNLLLRQINSQVFIIDAKFPTKSKKLSGPPLRVSENILLD
jgi:hypothetical protein